MSDMARAVGNIFVAFATIWRSCGNPIKNLHQALERLNKIAATAATFDKRRVRRPLNRTASLGRVFAPGRAPALMKLGHTQGTFEMGAFSNSYVLRVLLVTPTPARNLDTVARQRRWLRTSLPPRRIRVSLLPLWERRDLRRQRQDFAPEQRDTLAQQQSGVQIGKGDAPLVENTRKVQKEHP